MSSSGSEKSKPAAMPSPPTLDSTTNAEGTSHRSVNTDNSFSIVLEHASNNDIEALKQVVDRNPAVLNEVGLWYSLQTGSKKMVLQNRTPLMIAATYGSFDVLKFILSYPEVNVNLSCGSDNTTALHCAASSGTVNAIDVVQLLLSSGADPNCLDAKGKHAVDVIVTTPKLGTVRETLEELLSVKDSSSNSPVHSSSPGTLLSTSPLEKLPPPDTLKLTDVLVNPLSEKKEYPVDPSLPDIKNSIYATDEFRMFLFKVRPCSRAYSHDWTECPFVHPGENARRRDPRKYHYSCVPCPDFKKGSCHRGDMCEYAHGVFECWLHPAQYRTRLCKDGTSCNRQVCFFAHTPEELRPLYVSTGSAVASPRSSASGPSVMDMAAAMSLIPGSPTSAASLSPFGQPISPSTNGISRSSGAWSQPNVPSLHLPGSNLQSSRLRSSLSARDIPPDALEMLVNFDGQQQLLSDASCFSSPRPGSVSMTRSGRSKTLTHSNLEELFSAEISSPRYSDLNAASVFSPTHKSAVLNQFQQLQNVLSPINTNVHSPKNLDHHLLQASFGGVSSPGRMSPRSMEPISPMGSRLSALVQREKLQQHQLSLCSRDMGPNTPTSVVGSPVSTWSKWGSPNGKVDWSVNGDELDRMRKSYSFDLRNSSEDHNIPCMQSLVKDSPAEMMNQKLNHKLSVSIPGATASSVDLNSNPQGDPVDSSVIGAWIEQMQLDQLLV